MLKRHWTEQLFHAYGATINEARAPYIAIGAGVLYLVAFNTFLKEADVWYFGFIVLVAALCEPLLFSNSTAIGNTRQGRISTVCSVRDWGRHRVSPAGSLSRAHSLRRKS